MRRIVHHELGQPAQVLRVEDGPSESLGPDQVRVRVSYAPIHPGDLLGIMGSPAFGTPPTIGAGGRVPGFEGAGVVSEVGARDRPRPGTETGPQGGVFPRTRLVEGRSRSFRLAPWCRCRDSIPDEIGAQMLINTATAVTAIRTAHDSSSPGRAHRRRRAADWQRDPLSGGFSASF